MIDSNWATTDLYALPMLKICNKPSIVVKVEVMTLIL